MKKIVTVCLTITSIALMSFSVIKTSIWEAPKSSKTLKNPNKNSSKSAKAGKKIFAGRCVACHGKTGRGDGAAAKSLTPKPANLTSSKVQKQTDGEIFWKISNGNTAKSAMPKWSTSISKADRWNLVAYIRSISTVKSTPKPKTTVKKPVVKTETAEEKAAKLKKMTEKYKKLLTEGDKAYKERKWENARKKYVEAIEVKPLEVYPKNKYYAVLIEEADAYYIENKFKEAKLKYLAAEKVIEGGKHAKAQLSELARMEALKAEIKKELKQELKEEIKKEILEELKQGK